MRTQPKGMKERPSASFTQLGLTALPSAPRRARCHARQALTSWGVRPELIGTAELLICELVTNAVKATRVTYGSGEPGVASLDQISLALTYNGAAIRIEVSDTNPNPPVRGNASSDAKNGRGMIIVEALTSEWSYHFLPSGPGKTVYCVLPAAEAPSADASLAVAS